MRCSCTQLNIAPSEAAQSNSSIGTPSTKIPEIAGWFQTASHNPERARQNVIFELGYFLGKMGCSKVVALVENGVEIPFDYSGVVYLTFDNLGA